MPAPTRPWIGWYKTARWRETRARQLQRQPLCVMCAKMGQRVTATVCDHIERHKGNEQRFWTGPFQSLCKQHHDGSKQSDERISEKWIIGADGWVIGPRRK